MITLKNINADIGDIVTVKNGMISISPWSYTRPIDNCIMDESPQDGEYVITKKAPIGDDVEGCPKAYTLQAK